MLTQKRIEEAVRDCLIEAGTTFRLDQQRAYERAIKRETNRSARWVLERILENFQIAKKIKAPLCDDSGIPHAIVEIGREAKLPAGWLAAIEDGAVQGLRAMPGRPMAVKGNDAERVEQSRGLFQDPGKLTLAPVTVKSVSGKRVKITVLLLGGGPEIRAKTYRVFHQRSMDRVIEEAASWIATEAKNLGCTPCVPAIGIGRTHMEASALMLEAMKNGNLDRQNPLEAKVTELINLTRVGPLGLGGETTALGSFVKVGHLRASGVRIVSARPCCCFEPRRATVALDDDG